MTAVLLAIMIIVAHVQVVPLLERDAFNVLVQQAAYFAKLAIQVLIVVAVSLVTT